MKKRMMLIALAAAMVIGTTACSGITPTQTSESQITGTIETTVETTEATTEAVTTAPVEEAVKPGHYIEKGNLKISFEFAKQYDEIKEDEYYSDKPEEGKKYLVLFFEVENISSEEQDIDLLYTESYLDDYDINRTLLFAKPEGYDDLGGTLAPGKKLKGYVCYEVDSSWKKLEFQYQDGMFTSSPTYNFVVTPDDLS